ncbi:MAG: hypothetical protein ACYDDE_00655 [bacterium]
MLSIKVKNNRLIDKLNYIGDNTEIKILKTPEDFLNWKNSDDVACKYFNVIWLKYSDEEGLRIRSIKEINKIIKDLNK